MPHLVKAASTRRIQISTFLLSKAGSSGFFLEEKFQVAAVRACAAASTACASADMAPTGAETGKDIWSMTHFASSKCPSTLISSFSCSDRWIWQAAHRNIRREEKLMTYYIWSWWLRGPGSSFAKYRRERKWRFLCAEWRQKWLLTCSSVVLMLESVLFVAVASS